MEDLASSVWIILLTDKQTNGHESNTPLDRGNMFHKIEQVLKTQLKNTFLGE